METIKQDIDFKKIASETGVRKGKIFYSPFWEWVVAGHPDIDLMCIEPPYNKGELINGKIIDSVKIENNQWIFYCI